MDHRRIYEYVERHGTAKPQKVAEAVKMDLEQFNHELAIVKPDNYLEEDDRTIQIVLEAAAAEEYTSDGIDYVIRPAKQEDFSGSLSESLTSRLYLEG